MTLAPLLSSPLVLRLGYTLLHSLWQETLLCALFALTFLLRPRSAHMRYLAAAATLAAMLLAPLVTFTLLAPLPIPAPASLALRHLQLIAPPSAPSDPPPALAPAPSAPRAPTPPPPLTLQSTLPGIVALWTLGVLLLGLYHFGGWLALQRLRILTVSPVPAHIHHLIAQLSARLHLRRPVRILHSLRVDSPVTLGFLRPLILIPPALLTGLTPDQLQAILAHELAHIRRHDYLFNLLQTLVETLLFYHPAIWWVSHRMRIEREHCCDDIAAALSPTPRAYAQALLAVEELRPLANSLALAATGGHLLARIQRLLATPLPQQGRRRKTPSLAAILLTLLLLSLPLLHTPRAATLAQTLPRRATTLPAPTGIILNAAGASLPNAQVILFYDRAQSGLGNATVETVSTDSAGRFAFTHTLTFEQPTGLAETDHYVLFAQHPGYALSWQTILSNAPDTPHTLHLTTPQPISFDVTDENDQPAANVRISLFVAYYSSRPVQSMLPEDLTLSSAPDLISGTTDANGQLTLTNLPPMTCDFTATSPDFGTQYIIPKTTSRAEPIAVVLARPVKIAGTVVDPDNHPLPDAIIKFTNRSFFSLLVKADQNGAFTASLIPKGALAAVEAGGDGKYEASVAMPEWTSAPTPIDALPNQPLKNFTLHALPGTLVTGTVLEPGTERPVPGVYVSAGDGKGGSNFFTTYTDPAGHFQFRLLPGAWIIRTENPPMGYYFNGGITLSPQASTQILLDAATPSISVTLHTTNPLLPVGAIHGKILFADGSPASALTVVPCTDAEPSYGAHNTGLLHSTHTAEDGAFTITNAPVGAPITLYAQTKDQHFVLAAELKTTASLPDQDLGAFTLQPTRSADLLVTDAHNRPLAHTKISFQPTFDASSYGLDLFRRSATTSADGHLIAPNILPGLAYHLSRNDSRTSAILLSTPTQPAAPQLVLDTLQQVLAFDAAGNTVPIAKIVELTVRIPDGEWQLGPKPEIKNTLPDGTILIDPQQILLAHTGNLITLNFISASGASVIATAPFPKNTSRIDLAVQSTIPPAFDALHGPATVAPTEIAGRLLDPTGAPIAGATLVIPSYKPFIAGNTRPLTTSDADGIFHLAPADLHPSFYIQIDKPGFGRRWLMIKDLPRGHGFTLTLDNTTHLAADILLPDGHPAANATLTAVTSITRFSDDTLIPDFQISTTTDAQGHLNLPLQPATYDLRISTPDGLFAQLPATEFKPGQTLTQRITLAPGVHLKVHTIDILTGQDIPNAKIALEEAFPAATYRRDGSERTTDATGHTEWLSVMPGQQSLLISAPGYARHFSDADTYPDDRGIDPLPLNIKTGMAEVVIKMERGVHLTGKVLDPAGKPVAKAFVNIAGMQTGDARYMRHTNSAGEFDLLVPCFPKSNAWPYKVVVVDPSDWGSSPLAASEEFIPKPGLEKNFTLTLKSPPATQP